MTGAVIVISALAVVAALSNVAKVGRRIADAVEARNHADGVGENVLTVHAPEGMDREEVAARIARLNEEGGFR